MSDFQTTRWSLVARGCDSDSGTRTTALDEICKIYLSPLLWYTRRFGLSEFDAEDQVQEFLLKLTTRDYLKDADSRKGKLRTFLLASLKHHLFDYRKSQRSIKRGGKIEMLQLEDAERIPGMIEIEYDRQWAQTIFELVFASLENDYRAKDRLELFQSLKPYLVGEGERGLAKIAQLHGMKEGAIRLALHRMRKQFRHKLRAEVSQTLAPGDDLDEELRYLAEVFG